MSTWCAPHMSTPIRHCVAQRIQRWSLCQCGVVRLPGTRTYQSKGIDIHSKSYERSKSSDVYRAPRCDINSQCVMRVVVRPSECSSGSASRVPSTIEAFLQCCVPKSRSSAQRPSYPRPLRQIEQILFKKEAPSEKPW